MNRNRFFTKKERPIVLGHRGVVTRHQENTMAGFQKAVELGIDGVEFDVFLTKDGKLAVFHDEETERLTGVKGNITEMTWDEVSRLRIGRHIDMDGGRVVDYEREERVPLLEEVLEEFKGRLLMNIEMKAYAAKWSRRHTGTEVARAVRKTASEDSVIVTSFDFFMLYFLEREYAGLHSGFAYDDSMLGDRIEDWFERVPEVRSEKSKAPGNQNNLTFLGFLMEANLVGKAIGSTVVDADYVLFDSDTVAKFHGKDMLVGAYTLFPLDTRALREPAGDQLVALGKLVDYGVDWIETDDPERLKKILSKSSPHAS